MSYREKKPPSCGSLIGRGKGTDCNHSGLHNPHRCSESTLILLSKAWINVFFLLLFFPFCLVLFCCCFVLLFVCLFVCFLLFYFILFYFILFIYLFILFVLSIFWSFPQCTKVLCAFIF